MSASVTPSGTYPSSVSGDRFSNGSTTRRRIDSTGLEGEADRFCPRPAGVRDVSARVSAATMSSNRCQRASGSLRRHCRMTRRSAWAPVPAAGSGAGRQRSMAATRSLSFVALNGRRPLNISYNRAPYEKMSDRASPISLFSCSGAMYGSVPAASRWISTDDVGAMSTSGRLRSSGLARPKSKTFAPFAVIMTLPGFKSPCNRPHRCASASASAICAPYRTTSWVEKKSRSSCSRTVSPARNSITR